MRSTLPLTAAFIALAALGAQPLWAQDAPSAREQAAQQAAEAWLQLLAEGRYEESWQAASTSFRSAVTAAMWTSQAASIETQLGPLQSRRLESAEYTTEVPNAPAGEYIVLTYTSAFANLPAAREVVATYLEDDEWKVTGYFIQPPQDQ